MFLLEQLSQKLLLQAISNKRH